MIKKKGRGGARAGAGRKTVLSLHQCLWIGSLCDKFQADFSEGLAKARYEKQPSVRATRVAQGMVRKKRLTSKEDIRSAWREAYAGLKKADLRKPAIGFVSKPLRCGKTREQICKIVSDRCLSKRGLMRVTPRRVDACWKEYRAFVKRYNMGTV
jgi:hypothetical protein